MTRRNDRRRGREGFTMTEVLVSLAIVSLAVVSMHVALGSAAGYAHSTKINRQMRHLANFQYGQVLVGKLHPEEQDPFLDGQTGAFEDVGGYREEYEAFDWRVDVEEVALAGGSSLDMSEAGFYDDGSGLMARKYTDDIASMAAGGGGGGGFGALLRGEAMRPEGRYARRITLVIRYAAPDASMDRNFTLTTLVGLDDADSGVDGAGLPGAGGADGGTPGGPPGGGLDRSTGGNPFGGGGGQDRR